MRRGAALLSAVGLAALGYGFRSNHSFAFYCGAVLLLLGLVGGALSLGRGGGIWLPRLCLVLSSALLAFLLVELALSVRDTLTPEPRGVGRNVQTYDEARADRARFLSWWEHHLRRWAVIDPTLVMPDPHGANPYVLTPGARLVRGESEIRVNQLGFRGPEISVTKGDRFRIVALGESTTFGLTVLKTDRTWPAALEQRIEQELECDVPIEVINAGVAGWTLANQIERLPRDVFPLEPDLLISYHGQNGFGFFMHRVPGLVFNRSGRQQPRPSRILEAIERELLFRPVRIAQPDPSAAEEIASAVDLEGNPYAQQYRRLVKAARSAGVDLALCTFNLAVDASSPEEALRFYESFTPDLRSRIIANRLHSQIVRQVAERSGVLFVDTSAGLDGAYREFYVDLVHFNQPGRDRLAENILAGLRDLLRTHPRLNCRERLGAQEPRAPREPGAVQELDPSRQALRPSESTA